MDGYKNNMTSGPLHLATVGPRAPAFYFGLILFPYLIGFNHRWRKTTKMARPNLIYPSICGFDQIYIYIYLYLCYPPKIYHFQLFVDVKEVVFVGNLLQKQSRYTITFKKDEHILRSESTTFLEGSNLFQIAALPNIKPSFNHTVFLSKHQILTFWICLCFWCNRVRIISWSAILNLQCNEYSNLLWAARVSFVGQGRQ